MAIPEGYITGDELRAQMPGGVEVLTAAEAEGFIEEAIAQLDAAAGGIHVQSAFTRAVARRYAYAEALAVALARDGYTEMPSVDVARRQARELLQQFDASVTSPEEIRIETPLAFTGTTPW